MTDKALLLHWLAACSGPLLAAGAAQAQQAAPAQRPNILFILTDDQRWDAVGYVNPIVRTPHIDSLAREGVCFRNAFVTTPISAASRASLLTGMYERTHGYTFRQGPLKEPYMQQSYPVLLRASGYTTAYFGKFGVTYPGAQRLFDAADLYDRRGKFPDRRGYFYKTIDGDTVHLTRYTGYEAQRFLREVDPSKPFCLSLGFSAPHAHDPAPEQYFWEPWADSLYRDLTVAPPLLADDRYFEELPEAVRRGYNRVRWTWRYDTPQKYQHSVKGYYRMISEVDREVGAIRQVLRERGLDRNTIIVFMGDNGYFLGERQLAGKWLMYDRSLRVPMLIYDPRGRDPREVEDMVLNMAVPATILDAAGVAVPEAYQGVSLLGYTRGEAPAADREAFLCEHLWELDEIPSSEGIRTERWKYMRYRFIPGREELYDLAADSEEAVVGGAAPGVRSADRTLRLAAPPLIPGEGVPPEKSMPENSAQPRPYAFSGKSVRNASRGFFCRNEGFPRIFPMECNLLWLKMFGSLFRAGTCCRRAVCISAEKSVSLSEEPAPEGGRLIALGGLLPAGRILSAKR